MSDEMVQIKSKEIYNELGTILGDFCVSATNTLYPERDCKDRTREDVHFEGYFGSQLNDVVIGEMTDENKLFDVKFDMSAVEPENLEAEFRVFEMTPLDDATKVKVVTDDEGRQLVRVAGYITTLEKKIQGAWAPAEHFILHEVCVLPAGQGTVNAVVLSSTCPMGMELADINQRQVMRFLMKIIRLIGKKPYQVGD